MTRPAYLVSHTHWDREWYRTYQQFRLDLVRTMDGVLDTLASDPAFTHFLLDGQTIVLDDYLAMRPNRAAELRRQIEAGRIGVGPWYCHPDLFLVSGESLVRNLMLGLKMARDYGGAVMVGYVPDQFGHTGQLPQILQGFDIATAVLWRGVNARITRNESWWEAPDGSRVMLELLAQSYGNAQLLPLAPAALAERLKQLCNLLAPGATGPGVLLMNGNDHLPVQAGLPAALAEANRLLAPGWRVEQVSLQEALGRLRDDGHPEGVLCGELRSPATAHLLPGVLSTRTPLKRRNVLAQLLLERVAEPYAAWASLLDAPYPLGELWEAWRMLLQNHPHDSICGCSIDQVHREMAIRYDGVEQIGQELAARALDCIVERVDTRPPEEAPSHTVPIVVFNAGASTRTERARLILQLPGVATGYALLDDAGQPVPHRWSGAEGEPSTVMGIPRESIPAPDVMLSQIEGNRLMGMGLQSISTERTENALHLIVTVGDSGIMSREEIEHVIRDVHHLLVETDPAPVTLHIHRNARHELEFLARDVPAYGYTTFWLRPADDETLGATGGDLHGADTTSPAHQDTGYTISNDLFELRADPETGAVGIVDRRTGVSYGPCNVFVDGGDAGDSYTYSPPIHDTIVERPTGAPRISVRSDELGAVMRVEQDMSVPARVTEYRSARSSETVALRIDSTLTLTRGCPRIDVETIVHNTAEDHRLRVVFGLPFGATHVHAEEAYDVVRRPVGALQMEGAALEDPVADAPQHAFVALHEGERGLVVANVGLPEYEAYDTGDGTSRIALTLLRCVGWLSRDDLRTRRGGAGPALPVPEAQCPGRHTFTYSLLPLAGPWRDMITAARDAQIPLRALASQSSDGPLPRHGSLLTVEGEGIVVSAIKGADDGPGTVVRLFNATGDTVRGTLGLFQPATRVERLDLGERPVDTLHAGDPVATIPVELPPHRIETLRFVTAVADGE